MCDKNRAAGARYRVCKQRARPHQQRMGSKKEAEASCALGAGRREQEDARSNKSMQASAQSKSLVIISILHCAPPDLSR
jgi:hypothetical protein